ncbi:hypothetical protein BDV96DRAFT_47575 [Lophiotrema nucula]|uniref:Uncharacterized protein n=1 Tax=Lophiotrema nucula TaxID=690887 RepID=A0A6A5ZAN9_9PLEO|nr:hypothetical protein BDV96DRAFT_47575 [Lophiotrema nucula]
MPAQGVATTKGQAEVVLPFESKVKELMKLVDQTADEQNSDKKFLKNDRPAFVSGDKLEVLNACLSAVTVLSFLGGPAGIVLASGIVLFQGVLNVAAHAGKEDALTTMKNALEKIQEQQQTQSQLAKVKAIANIIQTQWKGSVDDANPGAEQEKKKIDKELTDETGAAEGSLGKALFNMENLLEWDNTDVRICILASLTYYFVVWNLQCRIWASFVRMESSKGEKLDPLRYETFVTTFRMRVKDMKNELNTRTNRVKELYGNLKENRINSAIWTGVEKFSSPFSESNTITTYVKYLDKYAEKEYSVTVPIPWWSHFSTDEDTKKAENDQKAAYDKYVSDLTGFATRAIANDLKVVDQWADIVHEAELLLIPPAPKVPPTVDHYQATEKDKVNQYLKDARWVAYAYTVGTLEDGDSAPSPWTDWLELKPMRKGRSSYQYWSYAIATR